MLFNSVMTAVVFATVAPCIQREPADNIPAVPNDRRSTAGTKQAMRTQERDKRAVVVQERAEGSVNTKLERLLDKLKPRRTITRGARAELVAGSKEHHDNDQGDVLKYYHSIKRKGNSIRREDVITRKHDTFIKKDITRQNMEDAIIRKLYEIKRKVGANIREDRVGNVTNKELHEDVTTKEPETEGDRKVNTHKNTTTISNQINLNTSTTKISKANIYESNPLKTLGREADKGRDKIHINTGLREITEHFQPIYTAEKNYAIVYTEDADAADTTERARASKSSREADIEFDWIKNNQRARQDYGKLDEYNENENKTKSTNANADKFIFSEKTLLKALVFTVSDMQKYEEAAKHPGDKTLMRQAGDCLRELSVNIFEATKDIG